MAKTQPQQQVAVIGFRPSNFSAGGGLVDDADLEVIKSRFIMTDYGGKSDSGDVLVLQLTMKDGDGTEYEQLYSAGNNFVPSEGGSDEENGKFLVPIGDKTQPSGGSNFAFLINSMVNAGLPEDLLDSGDISVLEGLNGHWNRVPQPKRSGLPKRQSANADREQTILVLTSIITVPGETAPAKGKTASANKAAAAPAKAAAGRTAPAKPAADDNEELTAELAEILIGAMAEAGVDSVKKVQVVQMVFKAAKDNPNKTKLVALAGKPDVLSALDGFSFDGTTLSMG